MGIMAVNMAEECRPTIEISPRNRRFRQVTSMNGNHHLSKYPQSATENNFTNVDTFFSDFSSLLVLPIVFVITLFLGEVWGFQLVLIFMLLHQHLTEPKPTNSVVFVVAWFFASWHLFFSTGHQTAFPVLHWNAAFFGVESADVSSPILPAMVMCLETFGGQIVMAMSLPSLMQSDRNDSLWLRSSAEFYVDLWRLFLGYLLCHSGKLFIVMLNAAVNRRHLMVWKIFAPRFMFEGISFLLTCLCLVIGYVYSIRAFNSALRFAVENEVPLDLYQRKRSRDSEKGSRKRR